MKRQRRCWQRGPGLTSCRGDRKGPGVTWWDRWVQCPVDGPLLALHFPVGRYPGPPLHSPPPKCLVSSHPPWAAGTLSTAVSPLVSAFSLPCGTHGTGEQGPEPCPLQVQAGGWCAGTVTNTWSVGPSLGGTAAVTGDSWPCSAAWTEAGTGKACAEVCPAKGSASGAAVRLCPVQICSGMPPHLKMGSFQIKAS